MTARLSFFMSGGVRSIPHMPDSRMRQKHVAIQLLNTPIELFYYTCRKYSVNMIYNLVI